MKKFLVVAVSLYTLGINLYNMYILEIHVNDLP
jgi:hypothetical protein